MGKWKEIQSWITVDGLFISVLLALVLLIVMLITAMLLPRMFGSPEQRAHISCADSSSYNECVQGYLRAFGST